MLDNNTLLYCVQYVNLILYADSKNQPKQTKI
jgi:hypothetical protein